MIFQRKSCFVFWGVVLNFNFSLAQKIGLQTEPTYQSDSVYFINFIEAKAYNSSNKVAARFTNSISFDVANNIFNIVIHLRQRDTVRYTIQKDYSIQLNLANGEFIRLKLNEALTNTVFKNGESDLFMQLYIDSISMAQLAENKLNSISFLSIDKRNFMFSFKPNSRDKLQNATKVLLKWLDIRNKLSMGTISNEQVLKFKKANFYRYAQ